MGMYVPKKGGWGEREQNSVQTWDTANLTKKRNSKISMQRHIDI